MRVGGDPFGESMHSPVFVGTEAVASGRFTRRTLASRNTQVHRNVYVPNGATLTATDRAVAAWLWSGRDAVVAGASAAALHGSQWVDADRPAELTRIQAGTNGIRIRREQLLDREVSAVAGIAVTSPARTAFDLGRRKGLIPAIVDVDALANATRLQPTELTRVLERHRGMRGVVQLRHVIDAMDARAESPQETRTRLALVDSGLRRPVTQIEVFDEFGHAFARIDMGWPDLLVGVEYDGPQHWTDPVRRSRDIDRYAELAARGWIIVRVDADLLRRRKGVLIDRVVAALAARGCPWLPERLVVSRTSSKFVA
jgi:hypothetical protein